MRTLGTATAASSSSPSSPPTAGSRRSMRTRRSTTRPGGTPARSARWPTCPITPWSSPIGTTPTPTSSSTGESCRRGRRSGPSASGSRRSSTPTRDWKASKADRRLGVAGRERDHRYSLSISSIFCYAFAGWSDDRGAMPALPGAVPAHLPRLSHPAGLHRAPFLLGPESVLRVGMRWPGD